LWPWWWLLFVDRKPDIRARISEFVDGVWRQISEQNVNWNIQQDYPRDYDIPKNDVMLMPNPTQGQETKPDKATGFIFISLGLLPIDSNHIQLGYATSQTGDPDPISGVNAINHQPFCDQLRISGLFSDSLGVDTYRVDIAAADENGPLATAEWQPVTDALYNRKRNPQTDNYDPMVLGPDPATGRYKNIDTQPEGDWHEHPLKVTWNSRNVADGYYAIKITPYDASGEPITDAGKILSWQMPIIRVDNSLPEIKLEASADVGPCGATHLSPLLDPNTGMVETLPFKVTCYDPMGHVKRYLLIGTRGRDASPARANQYVWTERNNLSANWVGVKDLLVNFIVDPLSTSGLDGCDAVAYNFELHTRGLSTNGYCPEPTSQWDERECNLVVKYPTT
jgi:hypothetical protein